MSYRKNWWSSTKPDAYSGSWYDYDRYETKDSSGYSWKKPYVPKTGYGYHKHSYYKKPDIISPTLHWVDENRVDKSVGDTVNDKFINHIFEIINSLPLKNRNVKIKLLKLSIHNKSNFVTAVRSMLLTIPDHIKYDIFKMYYHNTNKLEYEKRTKDNEADYEYIDAAINPIAKVMTEGSNLKSTLFTKDIIMYFAVMKALEMLDQKSQQKNQGGDQQDEQEDSEQEDSQENGESKVGQGSVSSPVKKSPISMGSEVGEKLLEKILEQTKKVCANVDNIMDNETQELLYNGQLNIKGLDASDMDNDILKNIEESLSGMEMNTRLLKEKLNKLLDRSTSNFSLKRKTEYRDIFSAEDFSMLDEYEMLHPKLRKVMMEDIMIPQHKYMGKVDIYVDISGSMTDTCGILTPGKNGLMNHLTKSELAKMIVYKLYKMDMVNNLFLFDAEVKKVPVTPISIACISGRGGTNIERVVQQVENEQRNAIIVTDAEDGCNIYSPKAFFLGVQGAQFGYFQRDILKLYSDSKQMIIYNGKDILEVDRNGGVVKPAK